MAVEQIKTLIRPNVSVDFNTTLSDEIKIFINNINKDFLANGSLIILKYYSDDELTKTTTETFANLEIFLEYNRVFDKTLLANNYPLGSALFSIKNQYYQDNNITFSETRKYNV
jgi:hypothetical protein